MFIVLGANGHVGSAVVRTLRSENLPVTGIVRDRKKAEPLHKLGALIVEADVTDPDALRQVLRRGRRAFLLNPPGSPTADSDAAENGSVRSILAALEDSGLEAVVAQSTYGAQSGKANGDLGPLWELEEGLRRQSIPATVLRAAYYMSNWDGYLHEARETGKLPTMIPPNLGIPMVAPVDLGRAAARMLQEGLRQQDVAVHLVEGPQRYSPARVARAMSAALGTSVEAKPIPRERWNAAFLDLGFSESAAQSYANMTAITVDTYSRPQRDTVHLPEPERGLTTIETYFEALGVGA